MTELFSKRYNIEIPDKEITIREDAPEALRSYIPEVYYLLKKQPSAVRQIVCRALRVAPDNGNWSERPNIAEEVIDLLKNCEWNRVYDIIELLLEPLTPMEKDRFHYEINAFFKENGIGWKLENGIIVSRGDESFENTVANVEEELEMSKLYTAKNEIKEAIKDMSRRPSPDITGAVQHSIAALECVSREVTGDRNMTLGRLISIHPNIVPAPLNIVIDKMWGFSSEQGRHLRESGEPNFEEAELLVHLSAALCSYLVKKNIR